MQNNQNIISEHTIPRKGNAIINFGNDNVNCQNIIRHSLNNA